MYAMWRKDYQQGVSIADQVAGILSGNDLRGLRGLWYYLAASASELASQQLSNSAFTDKAGSLYKKAAACLDALHWLHIAAARCKSIPAETAIEHQDLLNANIERMEMVFESRSFALAQRFEKVAKKILAGLDSHESDDFEEAHRLLGEMLGFEAGNSNADAAPDPWWISNGAVCLVAEDKSNSNPNNAVPVKHARQAASHANWIRDNVRLDSSAELYTVMITPQTKIHPNVPTYAGDVSWWHINEFRKWAINAINVLRDLRAAYAGPGQEAWRATARRQLLSNNLDPRSIVKTATQTLLRVVETE